MKETTICSDRIKNFALLILPDEETYRECTAYLNCAKYYTYTNGRTIVIFNIIFDDVIAYAKRFQHIPFLFVRHFDTILSVMHWKWGLLSKNKGRLGCGYYPAKCVSANMTGNDGLNHSTALLLEEFGMTYHLLENAANCMLKRLKARQQLSNYSDCGIESFIRESLNSLYCEKAKFYSRATIYYNEKPAQ